MYELKKMESYLRVNLLGPGPRLMEKRIWRAAISYGFRNTALAGSEALHRLTAFNGSNTAVRDLTAPPGATAGRSYCSIYVGTCRRTGCARSPDMSAGFIGSAG